MYQLSDAQIHRSLGRSTSYTRQRGIIFICPPGAVSDRLRFGIEREFPHVVIAEVETVAAACRVFPDTVSLILLHPTLLAQAEQGAGGLMRYHPLALIAVMAAKPVQQVYSQITGSTLVRGILPMDAQIDGLLAIVGFMLRGGEYFPRSAELYTAQPEPKKVEVAIKPPAKRALPNPLTKREEQILELVARGLQNKSIATSLHLSEYTVKIHLHNIITKLGAHNRTEAVSVYRDGKSSVDALGEASA